MPKRYGYGTNDYGFSEVPMGGCQWSSGGSRSNSRHNDELSFTPSGRTARMLRRRNPAVGREFFTDTRPKSKTYGKLLSPKQAQAMLPNSVNTLAYAALSTTNRKIGDCYATSAAQQSCPNGSNISYRCPFIEGNGCYAEIDNQGWTTRRLNNTAAQAQADSLEVANAEAAALEKLLGYLNVYENGPSKMLRLHVVGDAVTAESAKILADASKPFVRRNAQIPSLFRRQDNGNLTGTGGRGDSKVWAYTHGWRDVPRSAWGEVSVLASCETQEDLKEAYDRGYALACVTDKYDNEHLWDSPSKPQRWKAYRKGDFIILPCPNEAGTPKGTKPTCSQCGLCLQEKMLREKRMVIAFETHGSKDKKIKQVLVNIGANI